MLTEKVLIRKRMLQEREHFSLEASQNASKIIIQKILNWNIFQSAQHIGLYHAFRNEVDLNDLWVQAHHLNKKTYFPVVNPDHAIKTMRFLESNPEHEFSLNKFNIKEPLMNSAPIPVENLDCLFIPLVAFDKAGYRLGMGQGYYDRALSHLKKLKKRPCLVGIGYHFQEVDTLPHEPWDIILDRVITENY